MGPILRSNKEWWNLPWASGEKLVLSQPASCWQQAVPVWQLL